MATDAQSSTTPKSNEPPQRQVRLDDRNATTCYANFCRVTGSPEEMIVDFGMNGQPNPNGNQIINVEQRVVMNFYTAKRLLHALGVSVRRHEEAFGVIETDVQKRVISQENTEG